MRTKYSRADPYSRQPLPPPLRKGRKSIPCGCCKVMMFDVHHSRVWCEVCGPTIRKIRQAAYAKGWNRARVLFDADFNERRAADARERRRTDPDFAERGRAAASRSRRKRYRDDPAHRERQKAKLDVLRINAGQGDPCR